MRNFLSVAKSPRAEPDLDPILRKPTFSISSVDYKTSHRTVVLPGFINSRAFIPNIAVPNSSDVAIATEAALSGGFTSIQIMPVGASVSIEDALTLDVAKANATGSAQCDYTLSVAATADNATRITPSLITAARTLSLPFSNLAGVPSKVASIAAHFSAWPIDKPIVTDARTTDLASVLLLASLHGRSIHVTNVQSQEDIGLIALSKEKELKVTCDVSVFSLFFTSADFPGSTCLPSANGQAALWANLDVIDIFSVGSLPYRLATELGHASSAGAGSDDSIRLLLSAVNAGRLTLDDVTSRLYDNPRAIFHLPEQPNTYVEVELDRITVAPKHASWSPLEGKALAGAVHRVVLRGNTVFLDGNFFASRPSAGVDMSETAAVVKAERRQTARFSFSTTRPSLQSLGFPSTPFDSVASPVSPPLGPTVVNPRSPKAATWSPRLEGVDRVPLQPSL